MILERLRRGVIRAVRRRLNKPLVKHHLIPLLERFSRLRVVLEHITTRHAVEFMIQAHPRVAETITAHHLLLNRNALFTGGVRPHHYCRSKKGTEGINRT